MSRTWGTLLLLLALGSAGAGPLESSPPADPPPSVLLAAASASPDATVLLDEHSIRLEADRTGALRRRTWTRAAGPEDAWWTQPWPRGRMDTPVVVARVVAPDGSVRGRGSAALVTQVSPGALRGDLGGLLLPLPPPVPGSVVDVVWTATLLAAELPSWPEARVDLQPGAARSTVRIDAPRTLTLNTDAPGVRRGRAGERQTLEWTRGPEGGTIRVSAATDWGAVARATQGAFVAAQDDLSAKVGDLRPKDRSEAITLAQRLVSTQVASTGRAWGAGDLRPASARVTLDAGAGDPEDKAALLVSLLATLKIPAQVALVAPADGAGVPGLLGFEHVAVYVPGEPARWLNPDAPPGDPGLVPSAWVGREALVLAPDTTALTTIPPQVSAPAREQRALTLAAGSAHLDPGAWGALDALRSALGAEGPAQVVPGTWELELTLRHPPELDALLVPGKIEWSTDAIRLSRTTEAIEGGTVLRARLEVSQATLSAAQADAARARLGAPWPPGGVDLQHRGARLIAAGRLSDGLDVYRDAARARPNDAGAQVALAIALADLGFQAEAARALDPIRGRPEAAVATAAADLAARGPWGRRFDAPFDRAGALTQTRRALSLDPHAVEARALQADLLARSPTGAWLGEGSDPREAAALLEALIATDPARLDAWVQTALVAGQREGLRAWSARATTSDAALVRALLALLDNGGSAGLVALEGRYATAEGPQQVARLVDWLLAARQTGPAGLLLDGVRPLLPGAPEVHAASERVEALKRGQGWTSGDGDPRALLAALVRALYARDEAKIRALVTDDLAATPGWRAALGAPSDATSLPALVAADLALGWTDTTLEGDAAGGYHLHARRRAPGGLALELGLVVDRGRLRITSLGQAGRLARQASAQLDAGRTDAALRWTRQIAQRPGPWSPLVAVAVDADSARRAALAVLAAQGDAAAAQALQALRTGLQDPALAQAVDRCLGEGALRRGAPQEAITALKRLDASDTHVARLLAEATGQIDREAGEGLARALGLEDPGLGSLALGHIALQAGELDRAVDAFVRAAEQGQPEARGAACAWSLALGRAGGPECAVPQEALPDGPDPAVVAAAWIALGDQPTQALALAEAALAAGGDPTEWRLVAGLLAERAAQLDRARKIYAEIQAQRQGWAGAVARRRLGSLGR